MHLTSLGMGMAAESSVGPENTDLFGLRADCSG
jgi:hypothetical protein